MPYRPLFNEANMRIKYTLTPEELVSAIRYWLKNQNEEPPDDLELGWEAGE